jgi:hypothetical protein
MRNDPESGHKTEDRRAVKVEDPSEPGTESPEDTANVRIDERYTVAAGIPAILQTLRFTFREMGPVCAVEQLLRLNQGIP